MKFNEFKYVLGKHSQKINNNVNQNDISKSSHNEINDDEKFEKYNKKIIKSDSLLNNNLD